MSTTRRSQTLFPAAPPVSDHESSDSPAPRPCTSTPTKQGPRRQPEPAPAHASSLPPLPGGEQRRSITRAPSPAWAASDPFSPLSPGGEGRGEGGAAAARRRALRGRRARAARGHRRAVGVYDVRRLAAPRFLPARAARCMYVIPTVIPANSRLRAWIRCPRYGGLDTVRQPSVRRQPAPPGCGPGSRLAPSVTFAAAPLCAYDAR